MENPESVLEELEKFEKNPGDVPSKMLEDYMHHVSKTGDTIFPWHRIRHFMQHTLETVINDFFETCGSGEDVTENSNVPTFSFFTTRDKLLHHFNTFTGAPFTIQRLCEIMVDPTRHYRRTDKFLRGLEKNVLVVSTIDPGRQQRRTEDPQHLLINGLQESALHTTTATALPTSPIPSLTHAKRLSLPQSPNSILNNTNDIYTEIDDSENQMPVSESNGPAIGLHRDDLGMEDHPTDPSEPPFKKMRLDNIEEEDEEEEEEEEEDEEENFEERHPTRALVDHLSKVKEHNQDQDSDQDLVCNREEEAEAMEVVENRKRLSKEFRSEDFKLEAEAVAMPMEEEEEKESSLQAPQGIENEEQEATSNPINTPTDMETHDDSREPESQAKDEEEEAKMMEEEEMKVDEENTNKKEQQQQEEEEEEKEEEEAARPSEPSPEVGSSNSSSNPVSSPTKTNEAERVLVVYSSSTTSTTTTSSTTRACEEGCPDSGEGPEEGNAEQEPSHLAKERECSSEAAAAAATDEDRSDPSSTPNGPHEAEESSRNSHEADSTSQPNTTTTATTTITTSTTEDTTTNADCTATQADAEVDSAVPSSPPSAEADNSSVPPAEAAVAESLSPNPTPTPSNSSSMYSSSDTPTSSPAPHTTSDTPSPSTATAAATTTTTSTTTTTTTNAIITTTTTNHNSNGVSESPDSEIPEPASTQTQKTETETEALTEDAAPAATSTTTTTTGDNGQAEGSEEVGAETEKQEGATPQPCEKRTLASISCSSSRPNEPDHQPTEEK